MTTRAPLDSFESALLSELRDTVAERSAEGRAGQPRRRKPLLIAAAAATAVAATVSTVVFGLGSGGLAPAAAFSVSAENDGDIVVTIHRLDDADGLEQALAEHGITAEVSYGGATSECVQFPADDDTGPCWDPDEGDLGTGSELNTAPEPSDESSEALPADQGTPGADDLLDLCGFGDTSPASLQRGDDGWTLTIPADSPLHDGADLHLVTQGGHDNAALSASFSKGDTNCGSTEFVN